MEGITPIKDNSQKINSIEIHSLKPNNVPLKKIINKKITKIQYSDKNKV